MNEQNPNTDKKPRAPKSTAPKAHVLTDIDGAEWLVVLKETRVAGNADLNAALDGTLQRGQIAKKGAAS